MSASNEWTEWHLTPRGWEKGSSKIDFQGTTTKDAPVDRVITYCYSEYQSSGFGGVDKGSKIIWSSEDTEQIDTLTSKYGECPDSII
ncbi:hypothetical protein OZZ08_05110 [Malaciobacter mytili]|uniref:hypothetical protein n=1 Tax=Malaciobacter mytili TaxID=603050 RepID=UPI003BAF0769